MSIQPPGYVIQPGDYVEQITNPRARPGSVRVWADASRAELMAATCTACRTLTPVADLVRHAGQPGGYRFRCKADQRAIDRARVTSSTDAARHRTKRARYAARTEIEILADRARLRPDGLKRCRKCRESLPFDAFSVASARPDGLQLTCRICADSRGHLAKVAVHTDDHDGYRCYLCDGPAEHVDHVVPLALGGLDVPENCRWACAECNCSKRATPLFDWRPDLLALVRTWPCILRPLPK